MPTKPKPARAKVKSDPVAQENAKFLASLKRNNQVQEDEGDLKPGATHVLTRDKVLIRRRFSAIGPKS